MSDEQELTPAECSDILSVAQQAKARGLTPARILRAAVEYAEIVNPRQAGHSFLPEGLLDEARAAEAEWQRASIEAGAQGWVERASPLPDLIDRAPGRGIDIFASPSVRVVIRMMREARVGGPASGLSKYLDAVADALRVAKRVGSPGRMPWRRFVDEGLYKEYLYLQSWLNDADKMIANSSKSRRTILDALTAMNYPRPPDDGVRDGIARFLSSYRRGRRRGGASLSDWVALWLLERTRQGRGKSVTENDLGEAKRQVNRIQKALKRDGVRVAI
jgi:hypothetical protein